jgi:hypothetical protein
VRCFRTDAELLGDVVELVRRELEPLSDDGEEVDVFPWSGGW